MNANRDTLLDLVAAINDNQQFLEAEALHTRDSARRTQCQRLLRAQAATVSRIARDIARYDKDSTPLPSALLERYIDSLIETYTDGGDDNQLGDSPGVARDGLTGC